MTNLINSEVQENLFNFIMLKFQKDTILKNV